MSFFTQNLMQFWQFSDSVSIKFYLGESPALLDIDYHKRWGKYPGSTEPSARDYLELYLGKTLEERQDSDPFFTIPDSCDDATSGIDSLKLMNKMLQSSRNTWAKIIREIFDTNPSYKIANFWGFVYELSDFMPTPVLQMTFFEVVKQQEKACNEQETWIVLTKKHILNQVILIYADKMKEHVESLKQRNSSRVNRNSAEVIDIFTRTEQEKLGEYGIHLENQWMAYEEVEMYKNWASYMDVYVQVKGTLKGILETQAILLSFIKLEKRTSLGIPAIPSKISPVNEHWMNSYIQALTKKLIVGIQSLDDESLFKFYLHQSR